MKLVFYNNPLAKRFLFPGYSTIMFFGIILTKKRKEQCSPVLIRHEQIHQRQYFECFVLPAILFNWWVLVLYPLSFYVLYLAEWFISFAWHFFAQGMTDVSRANHRAHTASAMEMEAKEKEKGYIKRRKLFAFITGGCNFQTLCARLRGECQEIPLI